MPSSAKRVEIKRAASWLRALNTRPQHPRIMQAGPVVAENRLLGQPKYTRLNQVRVDDISYLPLVGGRWCYLTT